MANTPAIGNQWTTGTGDHGLGQTTPDLSQVAVGQTVEAVKWNALFSAINRCLQHQGVIDTAAPTSAPVLSGTAVSSTQINLSWTAVYDAVGVTQHKLYRNGSLLTTLGNVITYSNTGLTDVTNYTYIVAAGDAAGNWSGNSSPLTIATLDGTAPTSAPVLSATVTSNTQINLSWTRPNDNVGVTQYKIYRNNSLITTTGNVLSYSNTGLSDLTSYTYIVAAGDAANNWSGNSNTASATTLASTGVWTSGNNMLTGRAGSTGAGTQTAGLAFGGQLYTPGTYDTEEYNGTSWSAGGALMSVGTDRSSLGGAGTQTAGLAFGGSTTGGALATTAEYNGTSWSAGGNLATVRTMLAGAGTQTAGLAFGGSDAGIMLLPAEEYDGTSWSAGGNLSTVRTMLAGAGTQTAGLSFGGINFSTPYSTTEEYNGTSWSAGGALATARYYLGGAGTQTAGLSFGGMPYSGDPITTTEKYNGTSWSAGGSMILARRAHGGTGTQTAGLAFGGYDLAATLNASSLTTEEYNVTDTIAPSALTITTGTITSSTIVLNWSEPFYRDEVTAFELFRGSVSIANPNATTLTYIDTGLTGSTGYTYSIRARDAANNWSANSTPGYGTTLDNTWSITRSNLPFDMEVDTGGNLYITGGSLVDDYTSTQFIEKINTSTSVVTWTRNYDTPETEHSSLSAYVNSRIRFDSYNNLMVTGFVFQLNSMAYMLVDQNGNNVWDYVSPLNNTLQSKVVQFVPTSDGYLVLMEEQISSSTQKSELSVAKYDLNGNVVWIRPTVYGAGMGIGGVSYSSDGGYFVAGMAYLPASLHGLPTISKFNSSGVLSWKKAFSIGTSTSSNIYQNSSALYIITNSYNYGNPFGGLVKTNLSGNPLWYNELHGDSTNVAHCSVRDIKFDSTGNIYLLAASAAGTALGVPPHIYKFNSNGDVQWIVRAAINNQDTDNIISGYTINGSALAISSSGELFVSVVITGTTTLTRICRLPSIDTMTSDISFPIATGFDIVFKKNPASPTVIVTKTTYDGTGAYTTAGGIVDPANYSYPTVVGTKTTEDKQWLGNSPSYTLGTPVIGEAVYITPGTYSWAVPTNVRKASVVCVGAGGGSGTLPGCGGGLAWKNSVAVTPGSSVSVVVGNTFNVGGGGVNGGSSSFNTTLIATGGSGSGGAVGTYSGADGGGSGGNIATSYGGGGGAGGYTGNGGTGGAGGYSTPTNGTAGTGGAGGGGGGAGTYGKGVYTYAMGGGGGGVGLCGNLTGGAGGTAGSAIALPTTGGGGVENSVGGATTWHHGTGRNYGGGGGGLTEGSGPAGNGAVRVIWGPNRYFPTNAMCSDIQNTVLPTLSEINPMVGDTITCIPGTWTGTPTPVISAYQWQTATSGDISGAINSTYVIDASYLGYSLRCRVSASNANGTLVKYTDFTSNISG